MWRRPAPAPGGPAKPWSGPPRPGDSVVSTGDEIGPEEIWQEPASRLLKRLATNPSGLDTAEGAVAVGRPWLQHRCDRYAFAALATVSRPLPESVGGYLFDWRDSGISGARRNRQTCFLSFHRRTLRWVPRPGGGPEVDVISGGDEITSSKLLRDDALSHCRT